MLPSLDNQTHPCLHTVQPAREQNCALALSSTRTIFDCALNNSHLTRGHALPTVANNKFAQRLVDDQYLIIFTLHRLGSWDKDCFTNSRCANSNVSNNWRLSLNRSTNILIPSIIHRRERIRESLRGQTDAPVPPRSSC